MPSSAARRWIIRHALTRFIAAAVSAPVRPASEWASVPAALTSKSTHIPFFVIGGDTARLAPQREREAVMDKIEFVVEVDCVGGGTAHVHTIVISGMGGVYNVGPTKVRLRYDCPTSGEALVASFDAPPSAGRPFKIERVN
jgi:hypothetical protein